MPAGGILALDPATRTGWAFATREAVDAWPASTAPLIGTKSAPGCVGVEYGTMSLIGPIPRRYFNALGALIDAHEPRVLATERPFVSPRLLGNVEVLFGLLAITRLVANLRELPLLEASPRAIKLHATGDSRAKKPAMMAWAQSRGFEPHDHNAADALALLDWAVCAMRRPARVAA